MTVLTLVRGLPGSGKSTYAKKFFNCLHVEADMFFETKKGYVFDPSRLRDAHEWCFNTVKEAVLRGQCVVVSNTFSRLWEMEPYLSLTNDVEVHVCAGDYKNTHNVPEHTVKRMKDRWEHRTQERYVC